MNRKLAITVCALLIAMLLCLAVAVSAESVLDLSGYSDEEIVALVEQAQTEMVNRGIQGTADLAAGRYVGGRDIPAGKYNLICKTDSNHHGIVWVSAAKDDLSSEYPSVLYDHVSFDKEETYYFELEEGGILNLPFAAQLQIFGMALFK